MIYTAVFQDTAGAYSFEKHVATHDRVAAWHEVHRNRQFVDKCLVLLIDGQENVKTYSDVIDTGS